MSEPRIPNPVATIVGSALGAYYYSHRDIDMLFFENGAPGDPPEGSCEKKVTAWLQRSSEDPQVDALSVLGGVLKEFMDVGFRRPGYSPEELEKQRKRVVDILAKHGLRYRSGGRVFGSKVAAPTRSLDSILRSRDLTALDIEFQRALENVDKDPPVAVTSACAIVEATCKVYIEDEGLTVPNEQTIKPLWKVIQKHLGLDPAQVADEDLRRVLSGLASVIDGLGAFRTHASSAHGRGRQAYRLEPRHARLALHSAHSLVAFVLETWDA